MNYKAEEMIGFKIQSITSYNIELTTFCYI